MTHSINRIEEKLGIRVIHYGEGGLAICGANVRIPPDQKRRYSELTCFKCIRLCLEDTERKLIEMGTANFTMSGYANLRWRKKALLRKLL